ncbi:hypothetical protein [Streptosporangium sp. NPDC049644]|uniref:hypothetical protein n=1 Tax=Streptosporangium sp. NPDC049644 TaxID=3155507 RepID=UPI003415AD65
MTIPPLILDKTVLGELTRGDTALINLIQIFDAGEQPMIIPTLAITGVMLDNKSPEAADALLGLSLMAGVTVASLDGPEESIALADMAGRTGLDVWDAQAATEALVRIGAILTLDASRWEEPRRHIEEHLQVIEISDDM